MGSQRFVPDVRVFWRPPFQYALLFASAFAPKLLHLWSHVSSLPPVLYVLYLPTFVALDVVNAALFWVLVHLGPSRTRPRLAALVGVLRAVVCLVVLCASSMTMAFYVETGGEIKWGTAKSFANEAGGIKVLLSGSIPACLASAVMVIAARVISHPLYSITERFFNQLVKTFTGRELKSWTQSKEGLGQGGQGGQEGQTDVADVESGLYDSLMSSPDDEDSEDSLSRAVSPNLGALEAKTLPENDVSTKWYMPWIKRAAFLAPFITTIILLWVRPTTFPYAHMSGSIPWTLAEIWNPPPDICLASYSAAVHPFPLTSLITEDLWEAPHGDFIGWMPNSNASSIPDHVPSWLPAERMRGFERWYNGSSKDEGEKSEHRHHHYDRMKNVVKYDPLLDPARISNLDQDILAPITEALKSRKIPIKHVVLISLESTRSDVFPLKKGSHMFNNIMKTHGTNERAKKVEEELSKLTMNSELLSGESGGFARAKGSSNSTRSGGWRNLTDRGGINVQGALTGSTTSFKSFLGSNCGVSPLPVDFTVETMRKIYQPCIPQILSLFNHNKKDTKPTNDINTMPWRSVFAQSITDQYDHQDELNLHIGFPSTIVRETLLSPTASHPPTEPESNYFGFPESQIKPYLRDLFTEAEAKKTRLFLSHFTSSTHHPWNTPAAAGETFDFLNRGTWAKEHQLNRYLNTVRYGDRWVGELMDMLDDLGVADETLVVMIGDHGMAFEEDSPQYSTFENGHVSNIRVPLVLHHPLLPRLQLHQNSTSTSILPTLLDLLLATSSLPPADAPAARHLLHQYEGQSLIRPFLPSKHGRAQWAVTVLNAGGALLSISSAAAPWRLVVPVCKAGGVYRFTDVARDPAEERPVEDFSIHKLRKKIRASRAYAADAEEGRVERWIEQAEQVGKWWVLEQRRRWDYHGGAVAGDADPSEVGAMGRIKKKHWWET